MFKAGLFIGKVCPSFSGLISIIFISEIFNLFFITNGRGEIHIYWIQDIILGFKQPGELFRHRHIRKFKGTEYENNKFAILTWILNILCAE